MGLEQYVSPGIRQYTTAELQNEISRRENPMPLPNDFWTCCFSGEISFENKLTEITKICDDHIKAIWEDTVIIENSPTDVFDIIMEMIYGDDILNRINKKMHG